MTPEEHNRNLAVGHLVFGGALLLFVIVVMAVFALVVLPHSDFLHSDGAVILASIFGIVTIYGSMLAPSIVAGYALLTKKSWAKIAAIVAGVMSGMSFPMGTAICIYTFWFLFSEPGKVLYDQPAYALSQPTYQPQVGRREPPYQPPDWR